MTCESSVLNQESIMIAELCCYDETEIRAIYLFFLNHTHKEAPYINYSTFISTFKIQSYYFIKKIFKQYRHMEWNVFFQYYSLLAFSPLSTYIPLILILVGIDPRNLLTKAEVDAVMSEIAYPHYVFIIPEDQPFSYPLTIQDFIQLIERNPESYSQISKIRKHLCRSIFSPSRSNEILDRPNVVLHREQYQLTHKGKLPKRNFCLTFYNAITCTKNIDKFDYEILTSQREVAVRMILDYIRIIFSDAANSTNRNTSTIGRSATHSYGSNPFSPPNYKNSSNIIGRYKHSNSSSGPDNTTNTNTINTETGKEIRTNSNSISAVSPVVTKTSLQLQHNTNQALLYAHSGSVPSTGIMNTATRRRRSTSTRTQVASLGIARRAKEYDNSMALDKTPPLELLTAENTTADNTTIENTAEEKKDEINLNLTSVEQTPPLLEVDESNNTIDK